MSTLSHTERIYLDNAATTQLDPEVLQAMLPFFESQFGNPSSLHAYGREARVAVEKARKKVADLLGASPAEIFFTSGGTEADNTAICGAIRSLGVKHIITSPMEHHAVLHTVQGFHDRGEANMHLVRLSPEGDVDLGHLEELLQAYSPCLVSLMHGNNEVGNLLDLEAAGNLVRQYGSYFHSDTVQTMGHFPMDLASLPVDFVVGSAHKFHGPKGNGFLYISSRVKIGPHICGGAQERNMRGGTENVAGIVGMARALEIAISDMDEHRSHIEELKRQMIGLLEQEVPGITFNGRSADLNNSLYTVLSCSLPPNPANEMLLFRLDIGGVCASGGSACSSGAQGGSHVLKALCPGSDRAGLRFSFSKNNTGQEIEKAVSVLASLVKSVEAIIV